MALKLRKLDFITITNEDPTFQESSYADSEFSVRIRPLTRVVLQKLTKEATRIVHKEEKVDNEKLSWLIFDHVYVSSDIEIEDSTGIKLEDGSKEYKTTLFENFLELVTCLTAAAMRFEEKARTDTETVKN